MGAWWIAVKEFATEKGTKGLLEAVRSSKNPTIFTVLFEDTAAMLGLLVAFLGILLGDIYHKPIFDGVASLLVGVILSLTVGLPMKARVCSSGKAQQDQLLMKLGELLAHRKVSSA